MAFLDDTNCQLCERFIIKEQWTKHIFSSRQLHREVNGYWPAYFPQKKLTRDENFILEKVSWKMFSATRDIKEVKEFWLTYFMMTTNLKDFILEDSEELRKAFTDTMDGQCELDLYIKSFSNQLESDELEFTTNNRMVDGSC